MLGRFKKMFSGKSKGKRASVSPRDGSPSATPSAAFQPSASASASASVSSPQLTASAAPAAPSASKTPLSTAVTAPLLQPQPSPAVSTAPTTQSQPQSEPQPQPKLQAQPQPQSQAKISGLENLSNAQSAPSPAATWANAAKVDTVPSKLPPIATQPSDAALTTSHPLPHAKKTPSPAPQEAEVADKHAAKPSKKITQKTIDFNEADTNLLISTFGPETINQLQHESWEQRRELLSTAEAYLMQPQKIKDPARSFRAACILLEPLLTDKTHPIVIGSLSLLENMIATIGAKVDPRSARSLVTPLMPLIVAKASSNNPRVRESATQTLSLLAKHSNIQPSFVTAFISDPFKGKATPTIVQGRGSLICAMLDQFGVSLLPFEPYMDICQKFFDHPDIKSRQMALDIVRKLRSLITPAEYKKLESRLSDAAFKALHIAEGDTEALHPEEKAPKEVKEARTKMSMAITEEGETFRANKNSVSWAISDPVPPKNESSSPKARPPRSSHGNRNPSGDSILVQKSSTSTTSTRASSSTSNISSLSNFTREEEDLMNDIECRY